MEVYGKSFQCYLFATCFFSKFTYCYYHCIFQWHHDSALSAFQWGQKSSNSPRIPSHLWTSMINWGSEAPMLVNQQLLVLSLSSIKIVTTGLTRQHCISQSNNLLLIYRFCQFSSSLWTPDNSNHIFKILHIVNNLLNSFIHIF